MASTGQAKTYEDTVLGNRQFNLAAATQQDQQRMAGLGLEGRMAESGDKNYLEGQGLVLQNRGQIDALSGRASDEDRRDRDALNRLAGESDSSESRKRRDYMDYLAELERQGNTRQDKRLGAAGIIDEQERQGRRDLDDSAARASDEEADQRDYRRGLAGDASREVDTPQKAEMDRLLSVAAARAGIDIQTIRDAGEAMSDAEWSAIELELKRAGIDAAMIQSLKDDILKGGEIATKVA